MTSRLRHSQRALVPGAAVCQQARGCAWCTRELQHAVWKGLYSLQTLSHVRANVLSMMEVRSALWLTKRVTRYGVPHHHQKALWGGGPIYLARTVLSKKNFAVRAIDGLESPFSVYQAQLGLQRAFPFTASLNHICDMGSHPHPSASLP